MRFCGARTVLNFFIPVGKMCGPTVTWPSFLPVEVWGCHPSSYQFQLWSVTAALLLPTDPLNQSDGYYVCSTRWQSRDWHGLKTLCYCRVASCGHLHKTLLIGWKSYFRLVFHQMKEVAYPCIQNQCCAPSLWSLHIELQKLGEQRSCYDVWVQLRCASSLLQWK